MSGRRKIECPACGAEVPVEFGRNGLLTMPRHVAKGERARKCGCRYPTTWAAWVERVRSWGGKDPK